MTEIRVIVAGAEEAYEYEAELWCGNELMAITVLHEGRLHLRIDPRATARRGWPTSAAWRAPWRRPSSGSRRTEDSQGDRAMPRESAPQNFGAPFS